MTPMSRAVPRSTWTIADFPLVARISLHAWIVLLFGAPSCLVTSTAEFPVPAPSPPFLDANTALATPQGGTEVPVTKLVRVTDDTERVTFQAEVRSEDTGRPLSARVFLNYEIDPFENHYDRVGGGETLPPDTFDNPRTISATLRLSNPKVEDGCYQVALVATHEWDSELLIPADQGDTAMVVWWMIKGDPEQVSAADCPGVPPSADAGLSGDGGGE